MKLFCIECDDTITARRTNGKEVYPHREDLFNKVFYKCDTCKNFVGTHSGKDNSGQPLGSIPNKELKQWRMRIHNIIDPLWKSKKIKRNQVYKFISQELGFTYHTANLNSIDDCKKVLEVVNKLN